MSDLVPVVCYFTQETYRRLAKVADGRGAQVHQLIERDIDRALYGEHQVPTNRKPKQHYSPDLIEAMRHLHAAGLTDNAIAKKLQLSQANVSRRLRGMNLASNGRKISAEVAS